MASEVDLSSPTLAALVLPADNTSQDTAQSYLAHLTSLSLPDLLATPPQLQTHAHHLTASLATLTHASYPAFLAAHKSTSSLRSALAAISDAPAAPAAAALEEAAHKFSQDAAPVLRERARARGVLEVHDKLRDLLDAPVLIDTCVRNGYFSEALSLAAHVGAALPEDVDLDIARDLRLEVAQSVRGMLATLLGTLREPGRKLPALWKAAGFIRRMHVLSEEELALAFLSGRGECLRSALEGLEGVGAFSGDGKETEREREDAARYLRRYIDLWREGLYDIITQFSAIFLEDPHGTALSTTPTTPTRKRSIPSSSAERDPAAVLNLLQTYTSHALSAFLLPTLASLLPRVGASALPSLLTQLTYCATAFARVGLDFRGLLGSLFGDAVERGVRRELAEAGRAFEAQISGEKRAKGKGNDRPSTWLLSQPSLAASPPVSTTGKPHGPGHIPPHILASYPPIAEYTNALLTALNGLRLLAPVSIFPALAQALDSALAGSARALLAFARSPELAGEEKEREERVVRAAGRVFVEVLVPFVRRALVEGVYGEAVREPEGELADVLREWEGWLSPEDEEDEDEAEA